ncbi:MAG: AbrB/MazE/SpoVT family DNA-binding domain-containing protein [Anaerolineales bacterium]
MHIAKVSSKGWAVIPKELREKYGIKEGTYVQIIEFGDVLVLMPLPEDPVEGLEGMLADGPSLTADLLKERARERTREETGHG